MSNMRKSFEAKSKLRHMADGGGIFKSTQRIGQDDVTVFTDAKNAAPGAQAYTPRAFRELPNTGITPGAVPPMPAPAKLSVKPAAAAPLPAPAAAAAPQQFRAQTPYEKAAGQAPMPAAAKLSPMPIGPQSNYMAATGGFGPTPALTTYQKAGGVSGNNPTPRRMGAMGMPITTSVGYASGGHVKGPGGPTDDEVGPVMLSDGEYVLPADTVEKVGKENLDALKDATHTPVSVKQRRGLRKMVNGGATMDADLFNAEEQRRKNPQYYVPAPPAQNVIPVATPRRMSAPIPQQEVVPNAAAQAPVMGSQEAQRRAAEQTAAGPTAAMVATGTPNAQPMPPQRPSEILSGRTDVGVMRGIGKPQSAPAPAPEPQITSPTMTAAWQAAQTAPAGETAAGAVGRSLRSFGAAALAPVETGLRYMGGSLSALGGGAKDFGAGLAGVAPTAPAPSAPVLSDDAAQLQRIAEITKNSKGYVPEDNVPAPAPAPVPVISDPDAPFTPRGLTSAQSAELERQGVGLGAQMDPVMPLRQSEVPAQPAVPQAGGTVTPSAFASPGAKRLNSKYYQDANGAVIEGTAPVGAAPSVAAGPKTLGDPNGAPTAWSDVPRTYRSDTIREGVAPGEQVNLGNGIFATTDPTNGDKRLNSFTGVGKDFNADSARFGPDPNGADRARQDAMVERNLQAKPTPRGIRMPEFRSGERDINARFDKQLRAAEQRFTSPRAAGNLAKAQLQIEEARAAALNQDADNITRQQQSAMQFQSDQSRNALTERDLAQRAAQAARADETDRLTIASQDQRAASAAAQTGALADREFERKNYEVAVKNKQFSGTYNDWVAYGGSRKQGGGQPYVNVKDVERNTKRVTDRVMQMFPDDPAAQANVIANARLFWGAPDAAVAAYAPVVNSIAQKLGRPDIGLPQLTDDGKETWDASAADLQKGSDNLWTDARASLWDGDGPAYKFVTDGGEEIFIAKSRLSAPEQRFLQSYLQSSKPKKERD